MFYDRAWKAFSGRGQVTNILGFAIRMPQFADLCPGRKENGTFDFTNEDFKWLSGKRVLILNYQYLWEKTTLAPGSLPVSQLPLYPSIRMDSPLL